MSKAKPGRTTAIMEVSLTERFVRDLRKLPPSIFSKSVDLIQQVQSVDPSALRQNIPKGWRFHSLQGSPMASLSTDMNFRILVRFDGSTLVLHRVVKHKVADRSAVNRNDRADNIASICQAQLNPCDLYDSLRTFGISKLEAAHFLECSTEDDLLDATERVSQQTAKLALELYQMSGLVISEARSRTIQKDDDLLKALEAGGGEWELYLHPSQAYIVERFSSSRSAIVGSAGTGKTVCAWYRSKHLIDSGLRVGFVCPHESVLNLSKSRLLNIVKNNYGSINFVVPKSEWELIESSKWVDHLVFDEAQEVPPTWLAQLGDQLDDGAGITLFYDVNQLGGNIKSGDTRRYINRIERWNFMLNEFPKMDKFTLSINYRNSREISGYYLEYVSRYLPVSPVVDVPVFETGEVVHHKVSRQEKNEFLLSLLHRLVRVYSPRQIGVVMLGKKSELRDTLSALHSRMFRVSSDAATDSIVITSPSKIRGYERDVMIVMTVNDRDIRRNYGGAIDAYIAMSRAVKQLFFIEVISK